MAIGVDLQKKLDKLKVLLRDCGSLAVAFSGGVDSTFLLKIAVEEIGDKAVAIYVDSPLQPRREKKEVKRLIRNMGAALHILSVNELNHKAFVENPPDRCYHCKGLIFDNIIEVSHLQGIAVIADGSNFDDTKDYRPGLKALKERKIRSPLQEVGLTKDEIRILSKEYGLPTWDKDAIACLATRIPFGEAVTAERLSKVDRIEEFLTELNFRNVRARYLGEIVLVEVREDQVTRLSEAVMMQKLEQFVRKIGFKQFEIAPEGYRKGRMNPQTPAD